MEQHRTKIENTIGKYRNTLEIHVCYIYIYIYLLYIYIYICIYIYCSLNVFGAMRKSSRRSLPRSLRMLLLRRRSCEEGQCLCSFSIEANAKVFAKCACDAYRNYNGPVIQFVSYTYIYYTYIYLSIFLYSYIYIYIHTYICIYILLLFF